MPLNKQTLDRYAYGGKLKAETLDKYAYGTEAKKPFIGPQPAPKWWEKELRTAGEFVKFPYTVTKEFTYPIAKGTARAIPALFTSREKAQKIAREEIEPAAEAGAEMGKAFGGGVLDWLKMSLLSDTPAGIVAKQRIGDRIKEHGYLAEAVHPAVLLGLVKGGAKRLATKKPSALKARLKALEEWEPGISRTRLAERLKRLREEKMPPRRKLALKKKLKAERVGISEADLKTTANEMLNDAKYIKAPRVAKGTPATGVQVDYSASAPDWYTRMRSGTGMGKAETLTGLRAIVKEGAATKNVQGQRLLSYVEEWAQRKPGKGAGEMVAAEFKAGDRVRIGDEWYKAKVNDKTGEVKLIDSQSVSMDIFDKVVVDEFRPASVAARPTKQAELAGLQRAEAEAITGGKIKKVTGTKAIKEEMLGRKEGEVLPGQLEMGRLTGEQLIERGRLRYMGKHFRTDKWQFKDERGHWITTRIKENAIAEANRAIQAKPAPAQTGAAPTGKGKPAAREPWEMTREKFANLTELSDEQYAQLSSGYLVSDQWRISENMKTKTGRNELHRVSINQALSEGKPVPEAVLAEYPELAKKGRIGRAKTALDVAEKKATERIKKRGTRLTAGIDPAEMADLAIIGAAKIAKGTIKFGEWSAEMVREYGARVKPYLKRIYARSQQGVPKLRANAELDSFLDYFEDIQAPAGFRPPRKPARAAIRERLREEGLRGKELTQETNAEFIVAAHHYGIALRKAKGGKVQPAVRVAGTYVPEDFATYPKFKDAKAGILGGTKDATRFIQEIDGALSVEAKAKLPGQGGPAERYVLHRTRDMVKSKLSWTNAMKSRLATITKGSSKKQLQTANQVIEHISREGAYVDPAKLVTNPKISALTTDVKVIRLAQEGRKLYESLLRHQNELRRLIGREQIPHRDYYTAHSIHETTIWERAVGHNKTPKQTIGPGLPDYIKPNAPFNARAMAREIGLPETVREMDLKVLLERYIETAGKDIYSTSIIQNNKAFIQQLESMGYKHAARGLENWTAEAFGGVKSAVDRAANLSPTIHRGMSRFRQGLVRSVFPLNFAWNSFVQTSSGVLTFSRYGARNSVKGLYDWFGSRKMRQEIRANAYSAIIKSQRSGRISRQDINRGVGAAQRLSRGKLEKASDAANFFTEWVERHLTGWSVATAKRHGAVKGLRGRALWEYASDGGAKTQSMYNLEDLPGMLRSEVVKTGGPFQTFSFEVFNTLREYAGKTGTPPATSAIRIKMALRFLAGVTAVNYIGQAAIGRKPWELSSFIPFYGAFFAPVAAALKGEDVSMTSTRGLPSPIGIAIKGGQAVHKGLLKPGMAATKELIRTGNANEALEEFMATGKWDKLRRFTIRYLSGFMGIPGGTQMNRVVDGLIAVSAGGMMDSAGRMTFPITDTKDKMRTFLAGPWASKGGQEYWDKRGKEIDLYIESVNNTPLLRDVIESLPVVSDIYKFGPDSPAIRGFDAFRGRVERKVTKVKGLETREEKVKYLQENKEFFRVVGEKPDGTKIRLPEVLKKVNSRIKAHRKRIRDIESDSLVLDKKPVKLTDKQKRLAISLLKQKIEKLAEGALRLKKR